MNEFTNIYFCVLLIISVLRCEGGGGAVSRYETNMAEHMKKDYNCTSNFKRR